MDDGAAWKAANIKPGVAKTTPGFMFQSPSSPGPMRRGVRGNSRWRSEYRVDEWGQGRAFREDNQEAQQHQHDHDWREPPFLAVFEKIPELG